MSFRFYGQFGPKPIRDTVHFNVFFLSLLQVGINLTDRKASNIREGGLLCDTSSTSEGEGRKTRTEEKLTSHQAVEKLEVQIG